ncbi:unnamed protein product [Pylaiella littoralis]
MGCVRPPVVAIAALCIICDRSSYAYTMFAAARGNERSPVSHVAAAAAIAGSGPAAWREGEQQRQEQLLLRQGLPAFGGDDELRAVLSRCELVAASAAAAAVAAAAAAAVADGVEPSETAPSPSTIDGPLEGLRRFSLDGVDGAFMGAAGLPLRYRLFPKYSSEGDGGQLRPGVVLLTGFMESMTKYGETIADLYDRGFSVYTYDHLGQGLSGRVLPDGADPTVAHIIDFDHYVQDLVQFSKAVLPAAVPPNAKDGGSPGGRGGAVDVAEGEDPCRDDENDGAPLLKLSVVAHSMGGLIAVNAALKEPLLFHGLALAAPMLAPNTGKLPNGVVGAVAWVATKLGQGHRSPIRRPARATMERSRVTHDRQRLRLWEVLREEVGCVLQRGPSFAWLSQAVGASKRARRRFAQLAVPILVLEAGLDGMVRSDGIERFRRKVPGAEYRMFEGAFHDLFDETDDIRSEVLRETCSFLASLEAPEPDRRIGA